MTIYKRTHVLKMTNKLRNKYLLYYLAINREIVNHTNVWNSDKWLSYFGEINIFRQRVP